MPVILAFIAVFILGLSGGVACVYLLLAVRRAQMKAQALQQQKRTHDLEQISRLQSAKDQEIAAQVTLLKTHAADIEAKASQQHRTHMQEVATQAGLLQKRESEVAAREQQYKQKTVSYQDLMAENGVLKRELRNFDVSFNKLNLDVLTQKQTQEGLESRIQSLGTRYLRENVKSIVGSISSNNYTACKQRMLDTIARVREIGLTVSPEEEAALLADVKAEFEKEVRAQLDREEQARIKAQIREEQKLLREIDREQKQLEREKAVIQAALDRALAEANDAHSEEVQRLRARLTEAEAKIQRAMSMAQQTRAGYVYVISNIGSFGESVFKIGMTRRLEPLERVYELGGASVPFPFDVHMMISCKDAPTLEHALHRALHKSRLNKIKPRKEYFRTDLETIRKIVEANHGTVEYVATPEALEYHQSMTMTDEDAEYIESLYEDDREDDLEPAGDMQ